MPTQRNIVILFSCRLAGFDDAAAGMQPTWQPPLLHPARPSTSLLRPAALELDAVEGCCKPPSDNHTLYDRSSNHDACLGTPAWQQTREGMIAEGNYT
jgi:hypothetical protein